MTVKVHTTDLQLLALDVDRILTSSFNFSPQPSVPGESRDGPAYVGSIRKCLLRFSVSLTPFDHYTTLTIDGGLNHHDVIEFRKLLYLGAAGTPIGSLLMLSGSPLVGAICLIFAAVGFLKFFELGKDASKEILRVKNSVAEHLSRTYLVDRVSSSSGILFTDSSLFPEIEDRVVKYAIAIGALVTLSLFTFTTLLAFVVLVSLGSLLHATILNEVARKKLTYIPAISVKQLHSWGSLWISLMLPLVFFYYIHLLAYYGSVSEALAHTSHFIDRGAFGPRALSVEQEFISMYRDAFHAMWMPSGGSSNPNSFALLFGVPLTGLVAALLLYQWVRMRDFLRSVKEWRRLTEKESELYQFELSQKTERDPAFTKIFWAYFVYHGLMNLVSIFVTIETVSFILVGNTLFSNTLNIIFHWLSDLLAIPLPGELSHSPLARLPLLVLELGPISYSMIYVSDMFTRFRSESVRKATRDLAPAWIQEYASHVCHSFRLDHVTCYLDELSSEPIYTDPGSTVSAKLEIIIHPRYLESVDEDALRAALGHEVGHIKQDLHAFRFARALSDIPFVSKYYPYLPLNLPQCEVMADRFSLEVTHDPAALIRALTQAQIIRGSLQAKASQQQASAFKLYRYLTTYDIDRLKSHLCIVDRINLIRTATFAT